MISAKRTSNKVAHFLSRTLTLCFFPKKSANLPQTCFITLTNKRIWLWQICCRWAEMWQIVGNSEGVSLENLGFLDGSQDDVAQQELGNAIGFVLFSHR